MKPFRCAFARLGAEGSRCGEDGLYTAPAHAFPTGAMVALHGNFYCARHRDPERHVLMLNGRGELVFDPELPAPTDRPGGHLRKPAAVVSLTGEP